MIIAALTDFISTGNLIGYGLTIAVAAGATFAFRSSRKDTLIKFQDQTAAAFQARLKLLESEMAKIKEENVQLRSEVTKIKEENVQLRHLLETIQIALRQRGINVTIDGDLITITDMSGGGEKTQHRRRLPPVQKPP
jgi:hypothetical protein